MGHQARPQLVGGEFVLLGLYAYDAQCGERPAWGPSFLPGTTLHQPHLHAQPLLEPSTHSGSKSAFSPAQLLCFSNSSEAWSPISPALVLLIGRGGGNVEGDCELLVNKYRCVGLVLSEGCTQAQSPPWLSAVVSDTMEAPLGLLQNFSLLKTGTRNGAVLAPACPLLLLPSPLHFPTRSGWLSQQTFLPNLLQVLSGPLFSFLPQPARRGRSDTWVWSYPPGPSPRLTPRLF